ncbi:MAG: hypothetical protein KBG20_21575 [Caldilineaceae bacterium]|nr:hypothetical protein [Caldilineaceae bacterium]MBP8125352.1 hypothetical protein [Caldilineaceae bacterium]MBP9074912.1 hypothetical protein [Caldilineaceae bacterium]
MQKTINRVFWPLYYLLAFALGATLIWAALNTQQPVLTDLEQWEGTITNMDYKARGKTSRSDEWLTFQLVDLPFTYKFVTNSRTKFEDVGDSLLQGGAVTVWTLPPLLTADPADQAAFLNIWQMEKDGKTMLSFDESVGLGRSRALYIAMMFGLLTLALLAGPAAVRGIKRATGD